MSLFFALLLLSAAAGLVFMASLVGVYSASFLLSVHLFLGIAVRSLYLITVRPDQVDILAPWLLRPDDIPFGELVLFLGAFIAVWLLLGARGRIRNARYLPAFSRVPDPDSRRVAKVWVLFILSLAAFYAAAISNYGGLVNYLFIVSSRVSEAVAGFSYYALFADLAVVASAFLYYYYRRTPPTIARRVAITIAVASILAFLFSQGGRGNLIQYVITLLIISHAASRKRKQRPIGALVGALAVAVLVTVVGLSVRLSTQENVSYLEAQQKVVENLAASTLAPFAMVDSYMIARELVFSRGHDYGYQFLTNVVKPIPRTVWPDKPVPLAIQIREAFWGDTLGGIPPGYIGEGYIAFGLAGVVLFGAVLAILARLVDGWYRGAKYDPRYALLYAILAPYFAFNLVRGGTDIGFVRMIIVTAAFLLVRWVIRARFRIVR